MMIERNEKPLVASLILAVLVCAGCVRSRGMSYHSMIRTPLQEDAFLILGFMGGRDAWDTDNNLRRLALKLRLMNSVVFVETVENTRRAQAIELIGRMFDRNQDGRLGQHERASARLILYGQSFGGAAVVKLARQLDKINVPVLLTVQIDSVGRGDKVIPPNVARAANLFQRNGRIIRGEAPIVAEDPNKTVIIGNFEFDYDHKTIDISEVPWHKKIFRVAHNRLEHDPDVWARVEEIILEIVKKTEPNFRLHGGQTQ